MSAFVCEVCFDQEGRRFALPPQKTGNGDVLREADCNHPVCATCMARYVCVRVEEQRVFEIRCPHEGCTSKLFESDVRRLAHDGRLEVSVCERFEELRRRDYKRRLDDFAHSWVGLDVESVAYLWRTTRLCPRCSVIITKASGCNSFYCSCGHHFNYEAAARPIGDGVGNFSYVIRLAQNRGLSIVESLKYRGDSRLFAKVERLAYLANLPMDEALDLDARARADEPGARARIRELRAAAAATAADEDDDAAQAPAQAAVAAPRIAVVLGERRAAVDESQAEEFLAFTPKKQSRPKLRRHLTWPRQVELEMHQSS